MAGEITTVARPYADAAFARAQETGQVEAWSEALEFLSVVVTDPRLTAQLSNPRITRERLCSLLLDICGDALPAEVANFVTLLARNARLSAVAEIARLFEEQRQAAAGIRHVLVRSAYEVDDETRATLAASLTKRFGGHVDLTVETDSALIGGIVIRAGDLVIDNTVRGKIEQLAQALNF